ncbi:MAG: hypothetical protein LLF98_12115 [Clostridium sp.]|uniref:5' nucleotidase, NT5C type n=1 Tax=Clostridium sp. TaxID=1506 RepID=UPI0025BF666E|nr:hypothetical protein [Clostridium sp.]MCE5221973.1 hypothetical protein [Clostridium sp.]
MKNLNICIDIDGTISDPYYWLSYANKYFNSNIYESQVTCYNIAKILNISENDYLEFYEKFKFEIHTKQILRDDVKDILDKLYKLNNIYFVTARDKSLELVTFLYLLNHEIPFDEVFVLGTHNKVPKAKDLNCDIFIEDSYENAIQLSNSDFKVILIDTNYNRLPLNSNIIRAYNWNEILKIITEISKEKEVI